MFYRDKLNALNEWGKKKERKPLIIRGARQVGKTTLVEMFSKSFDNYLYFNLDIKEDKEIFEDIENIDKLVEALFVFRNKTRVGKRNLVFIDEIQKNNLTKNLILHEHLPHKKGLAVLSKSQVLLLPLNDAPNVMGILPGKMYEYMALRRPILALGPVDADYAKIINETNSGDCHNFTDTKDIEQTVKHYFELFLKNKLVIESSSFEKYSRKNLAKKIFELYQK